MFDTCLSAWGFVENLTVHSPEKPENFVSFCQITIPLFFFVLGNPSLLSLGFLTDFEFHICHNFFLKFL